MASPLLSNTQSVRPWLSVTGAAQVITTQRELTRSDEENRALTDLALRGLQLLSSWNVRIMELVIYIHTL